MPVRRLWVLDVRTTVFTQRTNLPLVTLDKLFDRWLSLEAEVINYGPAKYSRPEIKGSGPICKINQITSSKGWISGGFTRSSGNRFMHIIFTDCFGNQTGTRELDEKHSIQKLDGINRIQLLHADLEKRNMHFIFTNISGRLLTFHSFSRSMHTADCTIHTSHGSCYYIHIIFTGPCSFLNFNGAFCNSTIRSHHWFRHFSCYNFNFHHVFSVGEIYCSQGGGSLTT